VHIGVKLYSKLIQQSERGREVERESERWREGGSEREKEKERERHISS
jgi:hypothetical protein